MGPSGIPRGLLGRAQRPRPRAVPGSVVRTPGRGESGRHGAATIVALVAGIVSIPAACCCYGGIPLGAAAIVFSILGKKAVETGEANNAGMAKTGLILGAVGVGVSVLLIILNVVLQVANVGYSDY